MENKDNLLGVIQTLMKWRKQIVYICLAAALGTAVISLLLPIYFQSTTVFLAASPDRISTEALFPSQSYKTYIYGTGEDIDRILTLAESGALVDHLIDSFKLYEHYEINPDHPKAADKIQRRFAKLYDVKKDKRDAIVLSVEDKDRNLAAAIANAAREKIDLLAMQMVRGSQYRELNALRESIQKNQQNLAVLGDTLKSLRERYGIYNVQAQTELLPTQYAGVEAKLTRERAKLEAMKVTRGIRQDTIKLTATRVQGLEKELEFLKEKLDLFNKGISEVDVVQKQFVEANQNLGEDQVRLKQVEATFNAEGSAVIVVEEAKVPVVKSWPKRSLIVIGATLVAFLFVVFGIFIFETYRDVNWKEILKPND